MASRRGPARALGYLTLSLAFVPAASSAHEGRHGASPEWSPDGSKILFASDADRFDHPDIWVMNADGTNARNLTRNALRRNSDGTYSPDGSRIAFAAGANREGATADIWVMSADGSGQRRLTDDPTTSNDLHPSWSPDGAAIVFDRRDDQRQRTEIWSVRADGSSATLLSASSGNDSSPSWAPDGSRVAFQSTRDGNSEIYIMRADGSAQVRLTATPQRAEGEPSWSPDGAWLAYSAGRGSGRDIYVAQADGSGERRVTELARPVWRPRWSPDGTRIAFYAWPPAGGDLYIVNVDGSALTRFFPPLAAGRFTTVPQRPLAGRPFTVSLRVVGASGAASTTCRATVGGRRLPPTAATFAAGRATCRWKLPGTARGKRLAGFLAVVERGSRVARAFSHRIGPGG